MNESSPAPHSVEHEVRTADDRGLLRSASFLTLLVVVFPLVLSAASCRWPELLRARLLAEGGTYMLGATFGQLLGEGEDRTLSRGIVIWTADDNASGFVAPVGGVLEWCPEDVECPDPDRGILRLKPRITGEGRDGDEGDLRAHTDLFVQWIQFEDMDRTSVMEAISARLDQNVTLDQNETYGVEPGNYLGQAVQVCDPEDPNACERVVSVDGDGQIVLSRRLLLTVITADTPAYLDPYLFFPEEVDGLGSEHDSLLGDNTPPELTGADIKLYPQSDDPSTPSLEPTNPGESIPHYVVGMPQYLDLAVLAKDAGAGACNASGCSHSTTSLGIKSITYYITDQNETTDPLLGPVTVDLRCLDVASFSEPDVTKRIFRPGTSLYDVMAMADRSDECISSDPRANTESTVAPTAIDTALLANDATYTLVVSAVDYGGNPSTASATGVSTPSCAPSLPMAGTLLAGCGGGEPAKVHLTLDRPFDLSLPRSSASTRANPYIDITTLETTPVEFDYAIDNPQPNTTANLFVLRAGSLIPAVVATTLDGSGTIQWDGRVGSSEPVEGEYHAWLVAYSGDAELGSSPLARVVLYRFELLRRPTGYSDTEPTVMTDRETLQMMVNNDDDDRDGFLDFRRDIKPRVKAADDEVSAIGYRVLPSSLAGTIQVAPEAPSTATRLWLNNEGTQDVLALGYLALPTNDTPLLLEAVDTGTTNLVATYKTWDRFSLNPKRFTIAPLRIQISRPGQTGGTSLDQNATYLEVGTWENAYIDNNSSTETYGNEWPLVKNGPTPDGGALSDYHFIDADPRRFYISLDGALPAGTNAIELGVFGGPTRHVVDPWTQLALLEQPAADAFVSTSQMLVGPDSRAEPDFGVVWPESQDEKKALKDMLKEYLYQDDEYPVYDGVSDFVEDDQPNDRTHKADFGVSGHDNFVAIRHAAVDAIHVLPVCRRAPDRRRVARISTVLFNEPFEDDENWVPGPNGKTTVDGFDWDDDDNSGFHEEGERSERYLDLSNHEYRLLPGEEQEFGGRGPIMRMDARQRLVDDFERARHGWAPACLRVVQDSGGTLSAWQESNSIDEPHPILMPPAALESKWLDAMMDKNATALLDFAALLRRPDRNEDMVVAYVGEIDFIERVEFDGQTYQRREPLRGYSRHAGLRHLSNGSLEKDSGVFLVDSTSTDPTTSTAVVARAFSHEIGHIITRTPDAVVADEATFDRATTFPVFYPAWYPYPNWEKAPLSNDAYVNSRRRTPRSYAEAVVDFVYYPPEGQQ